MSWLWTPRQTLMWSSGSRTRSDRRKTWEELKLRVRRWQDHTDKKPEQIDVSHGTFAVSVAYDQTDEKPEHAKIETSWSWSICLSLVCSVRYVFAIYDKQDEKLGPNEDRSVVSCTWVYGCELVSCYSGFESSNSHQPKLQCGRGFHSRFHPDRPIDVDGNFVLWIHRMYSWRYLWWCESIKTCINLSPSLCTPLLRRRK